MRRTYFVLRWLLSEKQQETIVQRTDVGNAKQEMATDFERT